MLFDRAQRPKRGLYGIRFAGIEGGGIGVYQGACVELVDAPPMDAPPSARLKGKAEEGESAKAPGSPVGVLTSVLPSAEGASAEDAPPCFALAMLIPSRAAVGTRVAVAGVEGEVVELEAATRAGMQAGGGVEPRADDAQAAAAAEAAAAEAERKKAKLAAMAAKMKALGLPAPPTA